MKFGGATTSINLYSVKTEVNFVTTPEEKHYVTLPPIDLKPAKFREQLQESARLLRQIADELEGIAREA